MVNGHPVQGPPPTPIHINMGMVGTDHFQFEIITGMMKTNFILPVELAKQFCQKALSELEKSKIMLVPAGAIPNGAKA